MTSFFHKKVMPEYKPEWNREAIKVFSRLPSLRRLQATPLLQTSLFLGKIYPMKLWSIVDFSINFTGGMALYLYAFGFVKQHNIRRFSFLRLLFVIPELILASIVSIICEHIAVMTMWFGNWYEFYIVQKETEETDQQEHEKGAIKMNGINNV